MKGFFDNTFKLTSFYMKRERVTSSLWILLLGGIVIALVPGMYAAVGGEGFMELLSMMEMPTMVAMIGPAYSIYSQNYGALFNNMMFLFTALTAGVMNIFLIVRHTRADEEQGRYEVVRSLPVGRLANLGASMILAVLVNLILSVFMTLGLFVMGDASMGFAGSFITGFGVGVVGLVFASFAGLFSQLASSGRAAVSYSFALLFLFYFMRAPGDINTDVLGGLSVADEITALLSPLGLILRARPFAGDYFWPLFLLLAVAAVVTFFAFYFNSVRDIDQGLFPARPGRRDATRLLRTPFGLTFRLTRMSVFFFILAMFTLGASYASVLEGVDEFIASNEMYRTLMLGPAGIVLETDEATGFVVASIGGQVFDILEDTGEVVAFMQMVLSEAGLSAVELFAAMINSMMALFSLVAVLIFALRAKAEEKAIRTELILGTATSRTTYLMGYVITALVVAVFVQVFFALGLYLTGAALLGGGVLSLRFLLEASLVYVPALWVMGGLGILFVGAFPKAIGAVWGYYGYTAVVVFLGRLGVFPGWLQYTIPFGFVPELPMDALDAGAFINLALLTAVAAAACIAGLAFYRRRDINAVTQ